MSGSLECPYTFLKLMVKKIFTNLHSKIVFIRSYVQKYFVRQELSATYGLLFFLGVKAGEDRVFGVFILLLDPEPAPDIDNAERNNNIGS